MLWSFFNKVSGLRPATLLKRDSNTGWEILFSRTSANCCFWTFQVVYEYGGQCFIRAYVDEIIIKNNRAVGVRVCNSASLASDEKPKLTEIYAPAIISATGIHNLYNNLLPQDMRIVDEFQKTNRTIPSFGHNYLFVAIKG